MYNSQYYTCEQIDQRLLQGYLDDYNSQNNTNLTKAEFLALLYNTIGRNSLVDNLVTQIGYYECDTAAGTAAKAITVANYSLFAGGSMKVKFANKNTANNATLNINSQGAKALYYQGERASSTNSWDEGEVVEIYYDGTSYYANNVKGGSGSGVYDVSVEHPTSGPNEDGKFTLEYILNPSNVNELIPVNKRYPGMSIQFVSTYDNKYVQARCMADEFTTDTTQWQGVDDVIKGNSKNLIENHAAYDGINKQSFNPLFIDGFHIKTDTSPVNGALVSNSAFACAKLEVKEGEVWTIKGRGGSGPRLYSVVDSSGNHIQGYTYYGASLVEVTITIPENAAYMYVNSDISVEHFVKKSLDAALVSYSKSETIKNAKAAFDDLYTKHDTEVTQRENANKTILNISAESTNEVKWLYDYGYNTYVSPVSGEIVKINGTMCAKIEVRSGEKWSITGRTNGKYRRYAVVDDNNNLIEGYHSPTTENTVQTTIITIPSNGKYLFVNSAYAVAKGVAYKIREAAKTGINDSVSVLGTDNLQTAINKLSIPYHKMGLFELESGYAYNASLEKKTVLAYSSAKIPVEEGQVWYVKGTGSFNYRVYRVVDINNNVITGYEALGNSNPQEKTIVMPVGAKYLYYNCITGNDHEIRMVNKIIPSSSVVYVAAYNSSELDKANADYVCTGTSDYDVINQAIASLENGGTVHLMEGDYLIDDFPYTTGSYPCAIELRDNGNPRYVIIEGVRPTFPLISGTRIIVTDDCYNGLDEENQVAVISQDNSSRQLSFFFRNAMTVKDLIIELPNCTKPVICISQLRTVYGGCEGVICYNRATYHYIYEETESERDTYSPTPNAKSIAFSGVGAGNSWYYMRYDECLAQGFAIGYDLSGDHIVMRNCASSRNILGYSFGKFRECWHHITLINCCSETDCQYMFFGKGLNAKEPVVIENFQMEHPTTGGPNAEYKLCEEDTPDTAKWCGQISYACMPNSKFFEDGHGKTFHTMNLRNNLSGSTAEMRATKPNYLESFYNETLNKMCWFNGTNWIDAMGNVV